MRTQTVSTPDTTITVRNATRRIVITAAAYLNVLRQTLPEMKPLANIAVDSSLVNQVATQSPELLLLHEQADGFAQRAARIWEASGSLTVVNGHIDDDELVTLFYRVLEEDLDDPDALWVQVGNAIELLDAPLSSATQRTVSDLTSEERTDPLS